MLHDPEKILETISYENLQAISEDAGQKTTTVIRNYASDRGKQLRLQGTTKSGKPYGFVLLSYLDEGERVYEINGQRFDQENYDAIIENVLEKMDNVNLAISEKFDQGEGGLSGKEYTAAAKQKPKVTVGEPYPSSGERPTSGYYSKKKPFWASK